MVCRHPIKKLECNDGEWVCTRCAQVVPQPYMSYPLVGRVLEVPHSRYKFTEDEKSFLRIMKVKVKKQLSPDKALNIPSEEEKDDEYDTNE